MKKSDIKELSTQELKDRIVEEKTTFTKFKFNHAVSGIENPLKIRSLRKTIARLKTELRSRELKQENQN